LRSPSGGNGMDDEFQVWIWTGAPISELRKHLRPTSKSMTTGEIPMPTMAATA
jgi:hypothetical protein